MGGAERELTAAQGEAPDGAPGLRDGVPPPRDAAASVVRLRGVRRAFGGVRAVDGIDLDVRDGEFLTLLGPSGSGKTTLLRIIAGLDTPDAGTVELDGRDVTALPPHRRDVHTVFQDYALFPHLTVEKNVAYALAVTRVPKQERLAATRAALDLVRLPDHGSRRPRELSGGQRQRVALARALVDRPRLLLLDEPLGALDLKLRRAMQQELKGLQRTTGITFVLVTHDQDEALSMSDRIAVLDRGRLRQLGPPREVYARPADRFTAEFLGTATVLSDGAGGTSVIRPEQVRLGPPGAPSGEGEDAFDGRVAAVEYVGERSRVTVELADGRAVFAVAAAGEEYAEGDAVGVRWPRDAAVRVRDA